MSATVVLMIAGGPLKGLQYKFTDKKKWTVGRACDCSLQLPGGDMNFAVSRHHCVFDIDPPALSVCDLGSLNGTYVNGARIGGRDKNIKADDLTERIGPKTPLQDGDVIRVGTTLFCVLVPEEDWSPEAPSEQGAELANSHW